MKVINLNKFKNRQTVELDGAKYLVNGVTVDMYLNDPELAALDGIDDPKERIRATIAILARITNIPQPILTAQPVIVLLALMQVAQGNDPTIGLEEEAEEGAEKVEGSDPNA